MLNLLIKPILLIAALTLATGCQKKSGGRQPVQSQGQKAQDNRGGNPPGDDGAQGDDGDGSQYKGRPQQGPRQSQNDGSRFSTGGASSTGEGSRYAGRPGGAVTDKTVTPSEIVVESKSTDGPQIANAAYGDYLWNPPGLPYPVSDNPIYTGAETTREYKVTDANDDKLMAYLVTLMNEQNEKDPELGQESMNLAKMISNINARVNRMDGTLDIKVGIKDGEREYIIPFEGRLTAKRRAVLDNVRASTTYEEIDRKREKLYKERKFRMTMACVDKTTGCESIIMRIDQLFLKEGVERSKATEKDWQLCRRMYALARLGNVHLQIDEADYRNHRSYLNGNQKEFLTVLANSAHYVRYITQSLQPTDRKTQQRPRLHKTQIEFFAVAYGFSGFQINLIEEMPMNYQNIVEGPVTSVRGPMLRAEDGSRIANDNKMYIFGDKDGLKNLFESAKLVENDGAGQMAIVFNYKGTPKMSSQVNFTTLFAETIDPFEQRDGVSSDYKVIEGDPQPLQTVPMPPKEAKYQK